MLIFMTHGLSEYKYKGEKNQGIKEITSRNQSASYDLSNDYSSA